MTALAVLTALAACAPPPAPWSAPVARAQPQRLVSLDYCADQMVLALAPAQAVIAVSPQADADPLFSARRAQGKPRVRADIEQILALRPTMVVRSYAGGPRLDAALRRVGIHVVTLPYAESISDIRAAITATGRALDAPAAARADVARIDAALARAARMSHRGDPIHTLYLTPGNVTSGPATLIGDIMRHAGLSSVEPRSGWHRLNVEALAATPPAIVIRAFEDSPQHQQDRWAASQHDVIARLSQSATIVSLPGSFIACGNGRIAHAIDRLAAARAQAIASQRRQQSATMRALGRVTS